MPGGKSRRTLLALSSIASRLARMTMRLGPAAHDIIKQASGGVILVGEILLAASVGQIKARIHQRLKIGAVCRADLISWAEDFSRLGNAGKSSRRLTSAATKFLSRFRSHP
jgi:hypothetical protein